MINTGFCRQITDASGTILLEIDKDNFKILDKLQSYSCTKMEIGDFLVIDDTFQRNHLIFSKDLKIKSERKSHRINYKLNDDRTKIVCRYTSKEKLKFVKIKEQIEVEIFKLLDAKLKVEIGSIIVFGEWQEMETVSTEDFALNYKVVR